MSFKINDYTKSREMFERAEKVIPSGVYGHLGPAEGCFIPVSAFPLFGDRAQGSYFWDVDGNKFIDYMCAYGPNVLGYNDPDVDAAAIAQAKVCNCTTSPSYKAVEFAELLVDTVNCADWAFFAKNGNDVTTAAIMTARAHTHRKKIIFINGFYHGISPWTQKVDYPGVIEEDVANNIYIDWNDIPALERVIAENEGEIAAFISTPYLHGNFFDNQLPADGYWQKVRELCTKNGIVLIVDASAQASVLISPAVTTSTASRQTLSASAKLLQTAGTSPLFAARSSSRALSAACPIPAATGSAQSRSQRVSPASTR